MNTAKERTPTVASVEQPRPRGDALLPRVAALAAGIAVALGVLGTVGAIADVDLLRHAVGGVQIKANAALALVMLGLSLWLIRDPAPSDERRAWSHLLAQLVVVGALVTLAGFVVSEELGLSGLIADPDGAAVATRSPHAAVAILLVALWFSVIDRTGPGWTRAENALAAVAGLTVLVLVVGALYGTDFEIGLDNANGIAPQTVVGLAVLSAGGLAARPRGAWMRLLLSRGSGGHTIRRLIPALIVVPMLCGGVAIIGVENGLFTLRLGAAVVVAAAIVLFVVISVSTARELEKLDDERLRLERQLIELAERDPLTGVYNRRRLDDELRRQLALARRRGSALSVLSIDLDSFKQTNDTYGHATGDELLIATGDALVGALRGSDFVCRPGGDEFLVLLPDTGELEAGFVAEKLVGALRALSGPGLRGQSVSASIGVACADPDEPSGPGELLARADAALYEAKQLGGDRCVESAGLVLD